MTDNDDSDTIRSGGNPYHDSKGRFTFGHSANMTKAEKAHVSSEILTNYPNLAEGSVKYMEIAVKDGYKFYAFEVKEKGNYRFMYAYKSQDSLHRPCNQKKIKVVKEGVDAWNSV